MKIESKLFGLLAAFFGIMALGMSAVICTAGIDLSVGSLMGLSGIVTGLVMEAGYGVLPGFLACMAVAALVGLINGVLIAYLRMAPFVVTLARVRPFPTRAWTEHWAPSSSGRSTSRS